jgi:hypothetical protein
VDSFVTAATQCTDATPGDCDDAQCDGNGACDQSFDVEASGYVCRASAAVCDAVETCDGSTGGPCPADDIESDGTPCDDGVACTNATCQTGSCVFSANTGQINVNVEVDSINTAVTRTLTFTITACDGSVQTKTASVVFDATGFGTRSLSNIDANSNWIAIREGHTLRHLMPLSFSACTATVDLIGADALVSGDFKDGSIAQDGLCDITDFSILARNFNTAIDATLGSGADATGDGVQGSDDFAAIQANFLSLGDALDACPASLGNGRVTVIGIGDALTADQFVPLTSIAADNYGGSDPADLNDDGVVDALDIQAFAELHDLRLSRSFERQLSQLVRGKVGRQRR